MNAARLMIPATALLFALPFTATAADNCTGNDVLVNHYVNTLEVTKGHSMTTSVDYSVLTTDDVKNIYHNATGQCSGTFLATPDGKVAGSGFCIRRDKDGDTQSISFDLKPGAEKGGWKSVGGTGKFAGKTDSGWFQAAVNDGKMAALAGVGPASSGEPRRALPASPCTKSGQLVVETLRALQLAVLAGALALPGSAAGDAGVLAGSPDDCWCRWHRSVRSCR